MKNRQHATVAGGIEKFVAVPAGGEGPGFRFAIADDTGDNEIRIIERGPVCVTQGVAELAALVDAAGRFGSDVAGNAAREAELLEELLHPIRVFTDIWVNFAVGAFEIGVSDQRRPA